MSNPLITNIFEDFQKSINNEQEIRESVRAICKELDQISREATTTLQIIHHDQVGVPAACQKARGLFENAQTKYAKLKEAVPKTDYYKYLDHWRFLNQRYSYLIALTVWLEVGILVEQRVIVDILGIDAEEKADSFHLDIDDYLIGLLQMASELSRLAVNSVTLGDYSKPLQISKFVMELNAGFRLLNLKNDYLRKRFDALKYDVKKIEEVVYDLSIRGLVPKPDHEMVEKVE